MCFKVYSFAEHVGWNQKWVLAVQKKKLRQKPQAVTAGDIEMLEAEAEAAGPAGDDHGSRMSRAARQEEAAKKLAEAEKVRMDR